MWSPLHFLRHSTRPEAHCFRQAGYSARSGISPSVLLNTGIKGTHGRAGDLNSGCFHSKSSSSLSCLPSPFTLSDYSMTVSSLLLNPEAIVPTTKPNLHHHHHFQKGISNYLVGMAMVQLSHCCCRVRAARLPISEGKWG